MASSRVVIKGSCKVKINNKVWNRMEKNLLRGKKQVIQTGWMNTVHSDGITDAQIAAWNEEGHENGGIFSGTITPPRPMIRTGFIPLVKKITPKYFHLFHEIAMGRLSYSAFNKILAEQYVKLLKETILAWDSPSNSRATVELKGFNDPLIHTGKMYDSVKYKISFKGMEMGT